MAAGHPQSNSLAHTTRLSESLFISLKISVDGLDVRHAFLGFTDLQSLVKCVD